MKLNTLCCAFLLVSCCADAQGTFVYDQQSADESNYLEGIAGLGQQPLGQSFTPALSSVGFIRIYIYDGIPGGNGGGTLAMNLRVDSITGPVLGSAAPTALPSQFSGPVDFIFATPVSVSPGTTYYLQPAVQSGTAGWGTIVSDGYNYSGGTAFVNGLAIPNRDFWFREGIVVPEPGTWATILVGLGLLAWHRRLFR